LISLSRLIAFQISRTFTLHRLSPPVTIPFTLTFIVRAFASADLFFTLVVVFDSRDKSYSSRSDAQASSHLIAESGTLFFIIVASLLTLASLTTGLFRIKPTSATIIALIFSFTRQIFIRSLLWLLAAFTAIIVFISKISSNAKSTRSDSVIMKIRSLVRAFGLIRTLKFGLFTEFSHFPFIFSATVVVIMV
jgi:hypothetical protein